MIPFNSIEEVFEAFNQLKVLIIGDAMIDAYTFGKVNRLSPEAPVPVVEVDQMDKRPGGAANVALNVAALGASPFLCSVVGDDEDGEALSNLLAEKVIESQYLIKSDTRRTTVKHRVMSGSKQLIRLDQEDTHELSIDETDRLLHKIHQLISKVDLVIIEDYDKGVLTPGIIRELFGLCKSNNLPIIVDPKFRNYQLYQGATLFKPNLREFSQVNGAQLLNVEHIGASIEKFRKLKAHQNILVTMSDEGMAFSGINSRTGIVKARKRQVEDVSGAGDTVVSIAGLCIALDIPLEIIAELANLGGGIVCEYQGVVPINKNQLIEEALKTSLLA